jgi:hypothetical protein
LLCARKKRTAKILAHGKHGFSGSVGKSECGIYYISLFWHQLRVWVLHEASEYFRVQRQSGSWSIRLRSDPLLRNTSHGDVYRWNWGILELGSWKRRIRWWRRYDCGWDSSAGPSPEIWGPGSKYKIGP